MLALPFIAGLTLTGCKKDQSEQLSPADEQEMADYSALSETESEMVSNDIFDNVVGVNSEVGLGGTGVFGRQSSGSTSKDMGIDSLPACLNITVTRLNLPEPFPVRITLDFGAGCPGNDGHTRSGKIITVYTGPLFQPGRSATTTFDNFRIDSVSVQGTHTITNTTPAGGNQTRFSVDVTEGKLLHPNGDYRLWTGHRVITRVEGNGTPMPMDDVFTIEGAAHGRVKHGSLVFNWQSEITEPLRKRFSCHWISKGILKVRRETLPSTSPWVAILDFGNGTCDFLATVTINGVSHPVQLPH
jgi:hypothetical protein